MAAGASERIIYVSLTNVSQWWLHLNDE